jgi:MFS family permease
MLGSMTATSETLVAVGGARDRARWVMLIVLLCGQFMALLDVTVVNVAMPTIGRSLHASGAELQLVIAGYTVSYAMLLITGARLGDLIGRRRMFLLGVGGFSLASLTCGLAPDIGVLIAARFVQGAAAAAMMPQIMTVIQLRFSGAERARALSAYTAVLSSGFVAGQVIGGVLVTADLFGASWRPVFLVNVPIGLAVLLVLPRVMPADVPGRSRRLDLPGLLVAVPAVCLVVLPLMLGHQENWPAWSLACVGAGLALVPVFLFTERRVAARGGHPLLSVSVFRAPGLVPGLAAMTLLMVTYGGFLFSFAIHLQAGLGDSALRAGLTCAPCAAAFGVCGYFWRRLPVAWHPFLTVGGACVGALGYLLVAALLRSGGAGGALLLVLLVVLGGGMAVAFSPLVTQALVRVPLSEAADASGVLTTAIQLSQAVGVAVFGSLFLTLDAGRSGDGGVSAVSGHAVFVTLAWVAVTLGCGALAAVPLARTVRAAGAKLAVFRVDAADDVFDVGFLDGQVEDLGPGGDGGEDLGRRGLLGVEREPLAQAAGLRREVPCVIQAGQVGHGRG